MYGYMKFYITCHGNGQCETGGIDVQREPLCTTAPPHSHSGRVRNAIGLSVLYMCCVGAETVFSFSPTLLLVPDDPASLVTEIAHFFRYSRSGVPPDERYFRCDSDALFSCSPLDALINISSSNVPLPVLQPSLHSFTWPFVTCVSG